MRSKENFLSFLLATTTFFSFVAAQGQTKSQTVPLQNTSAVAPISAAPLPEELISFPAPVPYIKDLSDKTLELLKSQKMADVETQIKSLSYKQALQETYFNQKGSFYLEGGHLVWKKTDGTTVRLVDKEEHPERGIANILISPDGSKVAYSTTLSGSDQHVWYIKSISDKSQFLMEKPILVRMDGFSWGQDSQTVYYSHFSKIEDVIAGTHPISQIRSFNIETRQTKIVFDHEQRANFAIYDVDGGQTLIAHRILGPGAGIKSLLSLYVGKKQKDSYKWAPLIAPFSTLGHFLGVLKKNGTTYVVIHSDQLGKTYGVTAVPISIASQDVATPTSIVSAKSNRVLHNSQMHQGRLFLEYYNPKNLKSSMEIVDALTGKIEKKIQFSDFGVLNHGSLSLPVSFLDREVTFKYTDVLNNSRVFAYNLSKKSLTTITNPESNPFDAKHVRVMTSSFKSQDGTVVRALKIYPVNELLQPLKPRFFFMKSYGMLGIKSAAEPTEALMTLKRGGVYFAPDIRGGAGPSSDWQIEGSRNFDLRYMDMKAATEYLSTKDPMYIKYGFKPQDTTVALGRSYNGSGMLNMAARFPETARVFVSVVPVWDQSLQIKEGRFGVISHSDYFPKIDAITGEMILDSDFYANIEKHNPVNILTQIPKNKTLVVYTGGRDDRIDQAPIEDKFIRTLKEHLGDNFHYIQNPTASHGPRWYYEELFTEIDQIFGF